MKTLLDAHDVLLLDLDGTLYRGATPLPGALDAWARAAEQGHRIGYLTNNGSRSPRDVAAHLVGMGFAVTDSEVVTSGQAASRMLAERLPAGAAVLVVGTADLAAEIREVGLTVTDHAEDAEGVVQGHSPDTGWRLLAEACLAIRRGALWVTCNVDMTLPTERGELPGNGSMVAALRAATEAQPIIAGKPEPWLFTEAVRRAGAQRPIMVGDRLETDIAGANAAGISSMVVLTGVSDAAAILRAGPSSRPRYLGADLTALHGNIELALPIARPPWRVSTGDDGLVLEALAVGGDPVAALCALCEAHWAGGGGPVRVRPGDDRAAAALGWLGLGC
ncbi:MAG: HAD-IIA family hydrolase [Pseudonocardia sp.]|nr:HAD-IIA family hydrolase [Pseudonocardia sp.]